MFFSRSMIRKVFAIIFDFFFPPLCVGCRKEGSFLCSICFDRIRLKTEQVCPVCKKVSLVAKTHRGICEKKTALNGLLVSATYHENPALEKAIKRFKYHYSRELSEQLGKMLVSTLLVNHFPLHDVVIVPIPLHKKREKWRGFNQAGLLADKVHTNLNMPLLLPLLKRSKNTKQQATLHRHERIMNLKQAFFIDQDLFTPALLSKNILLVDDVSSTLSTLNEAAVVLKQAGFEKVYGIVLARG